MKPTPNIYDASQSRDLSKLAPAKGSAASAAIEFDAWQRNHFASIMAHMRAAGNNDPVLSGMIQSAIKGAWQAARATPSPAPIQQTQQDSCNAAPRAACEDEIVGHKTFSVEGGGFRHEPLRRGEADAIMAQVEASERRRTELMPDELTARQMHFDAWLRLKELGWREAVYCPKDGSEFEVIEAGSTGVHRCTYWGDWPSGSWMILADGDMYPSRPVLYRSISVAASAPVPRVGGNTNPIDSAGKDQNSLAPTVKASQ